MQQAKVLEANTEKIEELIGRHEFHSRQGHDKKLFVVPEEAKLLLAAGGVKRQDYFGQESNLWVTEVLFRGRIFVAATREKL